MIELRKVSKSFSDNVLFDQVSFKFNEQKCKIKGLNGTGKSVLLKIIVGFSVPNTGEVYYDGLLLGSESDFLPNAGISINAPEFMKNWSGMENLMYLVKKKILVIKIKLMN
jgi:ABC-2 type transport system ATP-binding protein